MMHLNGIRAGFIIIMLFLGNRFAQGQSIFSFQSSLKYAGYLMESARFSESADEYERIIQNFPGNDSLKWQVCAARYKAEQFGMALKIVEGLKPTQPQQAALLMLCKMAQSCKLNQDSLYDALSSFDAAFKADAFMLNRFTDFPFKRSQNVADSLGMPELQTLVQQAAHFRRKKPGKAALLSALVPGLGKVYTKDYKDAIIAFMYVSLSAYQVYRGLDKKNGQWAAYPIIFAGFGGVFYLGNIYGSYNSARRYNLNAGKEFKQKAAKKYRDKWLMH